MSQNKLPHLKILTDLIKSETLVHTLIQEQYPATLEELYGHSPQPIAGDHRTQAAKVIELFEPQDRIFVRRSETRVVAGSIVSEEEASLVVSERERCTIADFNEIQLFDIVSETTNLRGNIEWVTRRRLFAMELFLNDASLIRWLCEEFGLTLLAVIDGSSCSLLVFEAPSEQLVQRLDRYPDVGGYSHGSRIAENHPPVAGRVPLWR